METLLFMPKIARNSLYSTGSRMSGRESR
jgi:hypothetical protein